MTRKLPVTLAAMLALASPALAEDITAAVRAAKAATFELTGGTEYTGYSISAAFDGGITYDNERAMIAPDKDNDYPPVYIYYRIAPEFRSSDNIVVTSFKMRRSGHSYDSERMPLRMRLEASPTGMADGDDWVVLAENHEDFPGGDIGHVPTADEMEFTVAVPRCCQGHYRNYRFVFTPRHQFVNAFHELYLNGEISQRPAPERLTWDGGAEAAWDATSANWKDEAGAAVAWKPLAAALVGRSLSVVGSQQVSALQLGDVSPMTVSGGSLRFASPAGVGLRSSTTVGADVSSLEGDDTADACVTGTRELAVGDYLPRDLDDSSQKKGLETIYWRNRRLADITGFAPAVLLYSGDSEGAGKVSGAKDFVSDGLTATAWFWRYYSKGDASINRYAWIAVKVQFKQVGNDITAQVLRGGYVWVNGYDPTQGGEIDYEKVLPDSTAYFYDKRATTTSPYVGIRNLLAQSHVKSGLEVVNTRHWEVRLVEKLPADSTDPYTGRKVLYATNLKLSEITGFSASTLWYNEAGEPATACRLTRANGAITVQFQRVYWTNVLCVKAEFTQEGDDVYVKALYAKYKNSTTTIGTDFDNAGGSQQILNPNAEIGYTLSDIVPVVTRAVCTFDGAFAVRGAVTADNVDLAFGGDVLVGDAEMFAATPVTLKDGAALSVAAGVAATTPGLAVTGTVSVAFADGASLAVGAVDLAPDAQIELGGTLGATSFRVGTSATLSRAELKKFSVSDKSLRIVQDAEGYLTAVPRPGLMQIFR